MDNVVVGEIEIAWNNFYAERHWECNPILQEVRMEAFSCLSSWFLHNGSSNFNIKEAAHRQRGIHTLGKDNNYGLFSAENSSLPIWPVKQTVAFWGLWTEDHMIWGEKKNRESAELTEGRAPEHYLYWMTGNGHFSTSEMGNRVVLNVHSSVSLNHTQPHICNF